MIQDDRQLAVSQAQLQKLEQGLARVRAKLLPGQPREFQLVAEGYVSEIDKIRGEIDEYLHAGSVRGERSEQAARSGA